MSREAISQHNQNLTRIAIFASGAGSNAKQIITYFKDHTTIEVALIVCNKEGAGVIAIANDCAIALLAVEKEQFFRGNGYVDELHEAGINFIVLAGFLWKIPETIIESFRNRIINIHPSLLPKYGGKGMYGLKVHQAVIDAGDKVSGITIHNVDEHYDNGDVIFQAICPVLDNDTATTLAKRIHQLEHENFPTVIEECIERLAKN